MCVVCLYSRELSAATQEVLTQELEACQQLHELEPDNKCEYTNGYRGRQHCNETIPHKQETCTYQEL